VRGACCGELPQSGEVTERDKQSPEMALVQMKMRKPTLEKIEYLKILMDTDNRTNVVKTSIDIAEMIADIIANGGRVVLEDKDGTKS